MKKIQTMHYVNIRDLNLSSDDDDNILGWWEADNGSYHNIEALQGADAYWDKGEEVELFNSYNNMCAAIIKLALVEGFDPSDIIVKVDW